jgi:hypothetical protein
MEGETVIEVGCFDDDYIKQELFIYLALDQNRVRSLALYGES